MHTSRRALFTAAAALGATAPLALAASSEPDAELVSLEAQRIAQSAIVGRFGLMTTATMTPADRDADEAAVARLAEIEDRIAAAQPTTLAGFRIKARLAADHFRVAGGEPDFSDELVLALLRDLGAA